MEQVSEIGAGIVIRGEISSHEDLVVSCQIEGTVEIDGRLTVSEGAEVKATIHARDIVVSGRVVGALLADGHVELLETADVLGEISTPSLRIMDGAVLLGGIDKTGLQLAS